MEGNGHEVPEALICTEKYCYNILQCFLPPGIAHIFIKTLIAAPCVYRAEENTVFYTQGKNKYGLSGPCQYFR